MRIGSSIGLIALGLILALAVDLDVNGLDISLIGWILTVVGVIGLIASLALARQNRPVVAREEYPVARPVVAREEYPAPPHTHPRDPDPRY